MVAVAVLYLPTYLLFGLLVYPFVQPYYTTFAAQLHLALPSGQTLLALEPARGLVYALAVLPLAFLLRGRVRLTLWLALVLATLNAWGPLVGASPWPFQLRLAHGLELTGDSLVQAVTIGLVLALPLTRQAPPD